MNWLILINLTYWGNEIIKIEGNEFAPLLKLLQEFINATFEKSTMLIQGEMTNAEFEYCVSGIFQNVENNIKVKIPRMSGEIEKLTWIFSNLNLNGLRKEKTYCTICCKEELAKAVAHFLTLITIQKLIEGKSNGNRT